MQNENVGFEGNFISPVLKHGPRRAYVRRELREEGRGYVTRKTVNYACLE